MSSLSILANGMHVAWYLVPLAVAVSLVYSATRFEHPPQDPAAFRAASGDDSCLDGRGFCRSMSAILEPVAVHLRAGSLRTDSRQAML